MAVTYWVWFGPDEGPGSVDDVVSHTKPVVKALREHATDIAFHAGVLLDQLSKERTGDAQVEARHMGDVIAPDGTRSKLDSYVLLTDPLGKGAAKGIEFGWERDIEKKDGSIVHVSVEGKYVITNAVARALKGG